MFWFYGTSIPNEAGCFFNMPIKSFKNEFIVYFKYFFIKIMPQKVEEVQNFLTPLPLDDLAIFLALGIGPPPPPSGLI